MKIKVCSDSSCDLSKELVERYDIGIVPLCVTVGDATKLDGTELHPDEIYAHVAQGGNLPSTSAINPAQYTEFFEKYAPGYDAVIYINIGSGFSSCHQNAKLAASEFSNVYPVDSRSLSTGQGMVVLEAAKLAEQGLSVEEIVEKLNAFTGRIRISFVLSQLDYMKKGGRCSTVAALGANLLKLKPCIAVIDGKMGVTKKYRGSMEKCLREYVAEQLSGNEKPDPERIFITHSGELEGMPEMVEAEVAKYASFVNVEHTRAGCTVSSHCGPGTLGIIFAEKE